MRALIITGNLVQDHEFIYPYYRLQEAGFKVDVASTDGQDCKGIIGSKIPVNVSTFDITAKLVEEYDLLVLPGGAKCMEYIRQNKHIIYIIKQFYRKNKIISSICHAAQLLISAKIVKGKHIAGYYSLEDDIKNAGAKYCDTFTFDDNIVSSSHYKHLGDWMRMTLEAVYGKH